MENCKILVVEDNHIAQKVARLVLKNFNCEVDIATSGREAIVCVQESHYDLLLMDIGLPDMDGFMATKTILRMLEESKTSVKPPIVALTAHGDDMFRQQCRDIGMVDFIVKPLTPSNCQFMFDNYIQVNPTKDIAN